MKTSYQNKMMNQNDTEMRKLKQLSLLIELTEEIKLLNEQGKLATSDNIKLANIIQKLKNEL